jgi:hypothetical protein
MIPHWHHHHRRGITSLLAMLFLVLFSTLAIGFYAATNTASQVSANDDRIARAFMAAESGMEFMKYQLARVSIPANTQVDNVMDELYNDLQHQLDGTSNLGSLTISRSGNTISIPGDGNGKVNLDDHGDAGFRITITDWAGEIVVKSDGSYRGTSGASRSITMDFSRQPKTTTIFDYAIASKGQIQMKKGAVTSINGVDPSIAQMMSAMATGGAITVTGGTIGGDLSHVDGGSVLVSGGSVGGSSVPAIILSQHVHEVDSPEFPTIDPTVYKKYATNEYVDKKKTQSNILIKANTNPKFNGNDTVQGIMYIESPNIVTFNGNFNLKGFIVMEAGASTTDALNFSGNLTMSPVPADAEFDAVRATSGVAILAPNAAMNMTGSSGGTVQGNIIVSSFSFAGAADLQVDQGTLMTLKDAPGSAVFNGSKSVKFASTGANNQPKIGVTYASYYRPEPESYQEVTP